MHQVHKHSIRLLGARHANPRITRTDTVTKCGTVSVLVPKDYTGVTPSPILTVSICYLLSTLRDVRPTQEQRP